MTLVLVLASSRCSSGQSTTPAASNARESSGSTSNADALATPEPVADSGSAIPDTGASPSADGSPSSAPDATASSAPDASPQTPLERERAAFAAAIPVFRRHCGACHLRESGRRAALHHFDITVDPFGGHHRHEMTLVLRRVLGEVTGREATMPPRAPGSVQGEDLALIRQWLAARDALERRAQ
ncbi:MAG: hypothetical protein JNK05_41105 [Myxococcales bacterium]|nr:hypothetical protein [Myxococcales bacterium]